MKRSNRLDRRPFRILVSAAVTVVAATAVGAFGAPPDKIALRNARIIPIVGETLEKGTILIEHGKIAAVGKDIEVPYDAREFDLKGKTVLPGMINVHTSYGMDIQNEPRPVTPQLDAADAVDPSQLFFEECLRLGITAVHVMPAENTVIGGVGRLLRPIGLSVQEMTLADAGFLKLSVSPRRGSDRMTQMAQLREAFAELEDYLSKQAEKKYEDQLAKEKKKITVLPTEARKRGRALMTAEDIDDQHRNLLRLTGGEVRFSDESGPSLASPLGAFVYCERATDVGAAITLAREQGFFDRLVFVIGGDCYKAIGELKRAARPVVLPADPVHREIDPFTGDVRETFVPKKIADAGLLYAIVPGPNVSLPERMLTYQAARCVREGISRDDALRAITLNPAKILGLERRIGSIEPGKDAHLAVFTGDPLSFDSVVEKVFIDGILAYEREKDVRLRRLTSESPAAEPSRPE